MIEFTQDGPFADKPDQLFPDRVRIVGLGQTGAAVCDQLMLHGRGTQDLWVIDTDQLAVEGSVVPNKHLFGRSLVHGLGCGGDLDLAREVVALEEKQIEPVIRGCDFLVIILGLAGATGVALAERLLELGREAGVRVIVLGVQPFAFEGPSRRAKSIESIASLRREADSVLVLSNDRLSQHPDTLKNPRHGYHLMHGLLAKTAQALAQIVCKRGLIQLSFADVRSLYARYTGSEALENCWVSHVEGTTRDDTADLIDELLEGPLVADETVWKHIDHAIVAVSGTRDLGLTDVQEIVGALKDRLPVNIPIATSASLDEESNDKVRVSVLFAMTAKVVSDPASVPPKKSRPVTETMVLTGLPEKAELEPPITEPSPEKKPKTTRLPENPKPKPAKLENLAPNPTSLQPPVEKNEAAPVPPSLAAARAPRRFVAKQEEMQFDAPTRGRFEKTHETMYRGENLDQPTFRRRGLKIKV